MLHEFLDSLAHDGEANELGVGFSVDPSRLADRFATFEAKEPGYCLVRIVQGLVRLKASKIELKVERRRIVLRAHFLELDSVVYLKPQKIKTLLSRPDLWDRTSGHLCVGVLASSAASIQSLVWTHGTSQLRSSAQGVEVVDCKEVNGLEVVVEKSVSSGEAFMSTTKEHIHLLSRLARCPVPVTLDKRIISAKSFKPKKADWYHACSGDFFLVGGFYGGRPVKRFSPLEEDFGTESGSTKDPNFLHYPPRDEWTGKLLVAVGLEGTGELYPVIDGAVGDSRSLETAAGAIGFYHVPETCKTDVSGLNLVDVEDFKRQVLTDYMTLLEKSLKHLDHVEAVRRGTLEPSTNVALALVSPEGLLLLPVFGLYLGLKFSYHSLSFKKNRQVWESELREQLEPRLKARLAEAKAALEQIGPLREN